MVNPVPKGWHSVSAYLIVKNSVEALDFYQKAFGAETVERMPAPDGKGTMHAEMRIGDSIVMMSDENPEWGSLSPESLGGSPVSLHIYVEDSDALFKRAIEAGCTEKSPMMDTFWGDRYGKVSDPFGYSWGIATHVEDVPPEEMEKRAAEWMANFQKGQCEG